MNNTPMQFKDFIWPQNPQKIEVRALTDLKQIPVPFSSYEIQEYGLKPLLITGSGAFVGNHAKETFAELYAVFCGGGKGSLYISGVEPMTAVMSRLSMDDADSENAVAYSFEFIECPAPVKSDFVYEQYHTVSGDQNLWSVALLYDLPIEKLMLLNPAVSNAWAVSGGDRVRIK